jgi:hypothetical protein
MRHITLEEAKKITHDYYDQYGKQDSHFAMLTAVNTFIDRHNADKLARKARKREAKAKSGPDNHPLTTDSNLYRLEPVNLADFLKSHYDAARGVFDFETPDGAYVFFKGEE